MSNLYKLYETDKNAEKNGVDVEVADGVIFKIARHNPAFAQVNSKINERYRSDIKRGVESDQLKRERISAFVSHLVKGWSGVTDRDDNEIPFNHNNCVNVLWDLPDLYDFLFVHAMNADNFNAERLAETAKN